MQRKAGAISQLCARLRQVIMCTCRLYWVMLHVMNKSASVLPTVFLFLSCFFTVRVLSRAFIDSVNEHDKKESRGTQKSRKCLILAQPNSRKLKSTSRFSIFRNVDSWTLNITGYFVRKLCIYCKFFALTHEETVSVCPNLVSGFRLNSAKLKLPSD
jgi:hypothetical protein